jgi:hypothetical protein
MLGGVGRVPPYTGQNMICDKCGKDRRLVGRSHNCVSNSVSNEPVVSNCVSNSEETRLKIWRRRNPERYREYMQAYMKKRRARIDG